MLILVAYDIADDRRLNRVAALMQDYGKRVQRSVFECRLDAERLEDLSKKLKDLLHWREDKVQIYPLCGACEITFSVHGPTPLTVDDEIIVC
ncbi:MAG: CRISPR-associated endonuclease Cas2 [Blastocatellales bacterium]|nr:CRISPR-associated endonuclease Cas2 [Blastocatellales bacterium]